MKLWMKILIGLVLGVITGLIFGLSTIYLKPVGTIFLSLINMIIIPLVLSSMTVGITSIHDPKKLGRLGSKTLLLYFLTTLVAIVFGLVLADLFDIGTGLNLHEKTLTAIQTAPLPSLTIGDILLSIVPSNPFAAMANGNIMQVIMFSVFLGLAINFSGEKGIPFRNFLSSMADVMYRLTSIVMEFAPIGVFAIMAWISGSFGLSVLLPLMKFLLVFYLACGIHMVIVFCGMLKYGAKISPWPFFKGMGDAIMMAFSTGSSSATLPVSMHCAQENLGVSKNISSFILPLGSTINMNGTAIFQTMSAIFIANAYGITLDIHHIMTLVMTTILASIGTAGVSGSGFIMLSAVLSAVGLPLEGLVVIAAIDRLRDMVGTVLNITGDVVVAVYVAKQENEFDEKTYYNAELVAFEGNKA